MGSEGQRSRGGRIKVVDMEKPAHHSLQVNTEVVDMGTMLQGMASTLPQHMVGTAAGMAVLADTVGTVAGTADMSMGFPLA